MGAMSDPTPSAPLKFAEAASLFSRDQRPKPVQMDSAGVIKRRILLGNDDPVENLALFPVLVQAGYDVTVAESGTDALQWLRDGDCPELAILRRNLPGTDPLEICARMNEVAREVYLILRCEEVTQDVLAMCLSAGADLVLPLRMPPEDMLPHIAAGLRIIGRLRALSHSLEIALRRLPIDDSARRITDVTLGQGY